MFCLLGIGGFLAVLNWGFVLVRGVEDARRGEERRPFRGNDTLSPSREASGSGASQASRGPSGRGSQ